MTSVRQTWVVTTALEGQAGMGVDMVPQQDDAATDCVRTIVGMNASALAELETDLCGPI